MIRLLRRKFIILAMLSLLGTMAVLCIAIGIGNHYVTDNRVDRAITMLYQNDGTFRHSNVTFDPSDFSFQVTPETPFETRYIIVELTEHQEVKSVDLEHIAALDRRTVIDTINEILSSGRVRGYVDHYRYGVFQNGDGSSTIVVLDCFLQLQAASNITRISIFVALACALIVFILLLFLSKRAIRPYVENLERQRQFVTDASHELKTPLAILSADMGLLEDSFGKNRWLESARSQISRLDRLIKNLVELARTEESIQTEVVEQFSVSEIAQVSVDTFQPMAEADGKKMTAEIAEDVFCRAYKKICSDSFLFCWTMPLSIVTQAEPFI